MTFGRPIRWRTVITSLIVNSVGMAEPRLFDADCGSAFFKDGLAFNLNSFNNPWWLAEELKETYVRKQLYPYGLSEMAPEKLTEDDYLNLILYIEDETYDKEAKNRAPGGSGSEPRSEEKTVPEECG